MTKIGAQLRDNPLPLLLVSAGVGLMMSRSFRSDGYFGGFGVYRDNDRACASEAPSGMMASMRDTVSDMTNLAGDYTDRARSGLSTLATEQPLVLGALGLLVGAALAAMLPRTQIEEEYVGSAVQHLRDQATNMASDTYERAKTAASKAVDVASREFAAETEAGAVGASSGGPSQAGVSSPGDTPTSGAAALGLSAGAGGARPSETIAAGLRTGI